MNRFFEFSSAQLRVIIFLSALIVVFSVYRFLRSYSDIGEKGLNFSVQIGDGDRRYAPPFTVDLNLSPADSLELLPGIGPVLAGRIVAFRDSSRFEKPEDIIKIDGVGYKTFERLKSYIEVRSW